MPTKTGSVTHDEWVEARKALLIEEKAFMRARDELSRRIREMPAEEITKPYTFEGSNGPVTLAELFGPKDQLVIYHFMLGPDWKEGCPSCSFLMDHVAPSAVHIFDRGVAFAMVSRGPIEKLSDFKTRMGWPVTWVSSLNNDFNDDFNVSVTEAGAAAGTYEYNYAPSDAPAGTEMPGLSVFTKDAEGRIFHTYSTHGRGLDTFIGAYRLLDIVPGGRNEAGLSFSMAWVRHHDRYTGQPGGGCGACPGE